MMKRSTNVFAFLVFSLLLPERLAAQAVRPESPTDTLRTRAPFIDLILPRQSAAQEVKPESPTDTLRMRAPIYDRLHSPFFSLNDEMAVIIREEAGRMALDDLFVGVALDSIFIVRAGMNRDRFIELTWLEEFREAMVIAESSVDQEETAVDPDSRAGILGRWIRSNRCFRTHASVLAHFYDVPSAGFLGSLFCEAVQSGSDRTKSRAAALKKLAENVSRELKRIYWLSAELPAADSLVLPFGNKQGVRRGMKFDIVAPDQPVGNRAETTVVPGADIGIAEVKAVSDSSCRLKIIRKWQELERGSQAVEKPRPVTAIQITVVPPAVSRYSSYAFHFHGGPLEKFDWGGGFQYMRITDEFFHVNSGFGFSGFFAWRFLRAARMRFGSQAGFDFDIPFRKDDNGELVSRLLTSFTVGITADFVLSNKADLVLLGGYRFGFAPGEWSYSVDGATYPAYWEGESPAINHSGAVLSIGYRYYF
jgi:hypothetical protein